MIEFTKTKARQCRFIHDDPKKVPALELMCCGKPTVGDGVVMVR